jgi:hypothetical protein
LDSQSNGLSYLIDRLKGQSLYAHVTLEKGERGELANLANNLCDLLFHGYKLHHQHHPNIIRVLQNIYLEIFQAAISNCRTL